MPQTRKRSSQTRKNVNKGRFIGPIQQKSKTRRAPPARYMPSSKSISRKVKSTIFNLAEKKFSPLTDYNESVGAAIQTGAQATCWCCVLGDKPSAWDSSFKPLGGIEIGLGNNKEKRIGDYVQLQKTHLSLNLDMKMNNTQAPPLEFRVIHFRQRRSAMPAGINPDPATSLFLTTSGGEFGHATSGINGTDLMFQPLNKKEWIIYKDQKFLLTKPSHVDSDGGGQLPNAYPCMKNFLFNFPFYKKAKYTGGNIPENVAYHHAVVIYARTLDKDQNSTVWEVNTRGTTTFCDF